MSVASTLKSFFIWPLRAKAKTYMVGSIDKWEVAKPTSRNPFVIAAGVGKNITYELDLAKNWSAHIVLVDPSPTGRGTMKGLLPVDGIDFIPVGLADDDSNRRFSTPISAAEGSFTRARRGDTGEVEYQCRSVHSLMRGAGRSRIDILKMDVEGFEYPILRSILKEGVEIDQICLELHVRQTSGVDATIFDAAIAILRLYLAGYRVIYNTNMDFTFAHVRLIGGKTGRRRFS